MVQPGQLGAIKPLRPTLRIATWPRAWLADAQPWQAGAQPRLAGSAEGGCSRELLAHVVLLTNRLFGPGQVEGVQLKPALGQVETRLQTHWVHDAVTVWVNAAVEGELIDHQRFELVGSRNRAALTGGYGLEHAGQTSAQVAGRPTRWTGFTALLDGRRDAGLATAG